MITIKLPYKSEDFNLTELQNQYSNLVKDKVFNRLTKNLWKRDKFIQNLSKRLNIYDIKMFKVNPAYSSFIGNLQYNFSDPVNASLEIARRGYEAIILKNKKFYPDLSKDSLKDRWKEYFNDEFKTWKDFFNYIKNSKLKYRVSLDETLFEVFRFNSIKSNIFMFS